MMMIAGNMRQTNMDGENNLFDALVLRTAGMAEDGDDHAHNETPIRRTGRQLLANIAGKKSQHEDGPAEGSPEMESANNATNKNSCSLALSAVIAVHALLKKRGTRKFSTKKTSPLCSLISFVFPYMFL